MPASMLPPPPAAEAAAPPPALVPSALPAPITPVPIGHMLPAPPAPLVPPAPPSVQDYLRGHVRPRTICTKCMVACGPDPSVREDFASEGGMGRARNISLKRACPLAAHAISASGNGVPLLEQYERDYGVKLVSKKLKFKDFMDKEYNVKPLGKDPHYKVSLYKPPRVNANLALEGGLVKLDLASFSYESTSEQGTKDNYMGFEI
eukprot:7389131-Prymnesium_polylepis.1